MSPRRMFVFRLLIHLDTVTGANTTKRVSHYMPQYPFPPPVETRFGIEDRCIERSVWAAKKLH